MGLWIENVMSQMRPSEAQTRSSETSRRAADWHIPLGVVHLAKRGNKPRPRRLRLYADENLDLDLVRHLRHDRRLNIKSAHELGFVGREDSFHFEEAKRLKRWLVTNDRDFLQHRKFPFQALPGIIILDFGDDPVRLGWASFWIADRLSPSGGELRGTKVLVKKNSIDIYFRDEAGRIQKQTLNLCAPPSQEPRARPSAPSSQTFLAFRSWRAPSLGEASVTQPSPRSLLVFGGLALCILLGDPARSAPRTQDVCSHPIPPDVWAAMTPNQQEFQRLADTLTTNFIAAVFGEGPYPPCLYRSVRDYFVSPAGSTPGERERARSRRSRALRLIQTILNGAPDLKN
jgi:predicted nuclease of predicted toxin-antitoxin system